MAEQICEDEPKKNLGVSKCNTLPQVFAEMITTPLSFKLTAAQAADPALAKTALQNALKSGLANRIYKWPEFSGFENVSEDAVYEETSLTDILVRAGKYRWRFSISKNLCMHKAMFSHNTRGNARVFFLDVDGNYFGTELSNGDVAGFRISLLNVEKLMISDGSVSTKSPVYVVLKDHKEIDKNGVQFDGSFAGELVPLSDVELEIQSSPAVTTDDFYVSVKVKCDGTPVSGLVVGDFEVTTALGVAQVPTAFEETSAGSGIYHFTKSTDFVDGFVNLVAAADLTVDAFESTGAVALNIP